ncbi:MAG: hypothetical protein ACHQX1_01330, partial [Candidatus Micrarchaeales archaeon]
MNEKLSNLEDLMLKQLTGKFVEITDESKRKELLFATARSLSPGIKNEEIQEIVDDINDIDPIKKYLETETVEDIMINNT